MWYLQQLSTQHVFSSLGFLSAKDAKQKMFCELRKLFCLSKVNHLMMCIFCKLCSGSECVWVCQGMSTSTKQMSNSKSKGAAVSDFRNALCLRKKPPVVLTWKCESCTFECATENFVQKWFLRVQKKIRSIFIEMTQTSSCTTYTFLGRARPSRIGLMESCTCCRCHCRGPHPP